MFKPQGITPDRQRMVVRVDEVDMKKRIAHVSARSLGGLLISFRGTHGAFRIPKAEEFWYVTRHGFEWILENRVDSQEDQEALQDLNPGDTRVHADGDVHINSEAVQLNSRPIGVTRCETFTTAALIASVTLTEAPVDIQSVQVYKDGTLIKPTFVTIDSIDNKKLNFSPSFTPTAWFSVYYQAS